MTQPRSFTLLGVFLTSLAVLALEIVLTRVFSVLMFYHFAFMVISLALLGSGAAGVWLYLAPRHFPPSRIAQRLALLALLFALGTAGAFVLYLQIPFEFNSIRREGLSLASFGWLALIYLVLAIPFLLGGATIALAISHFSRSVGKVYFYDLLGASAGCLISIVALTSVGAAGGVLLVSVLAALAALLFALQTRTFWRPVTLIGVVVFVGLLIGNQRGSWLQVRTRGGYDARNEIVYEKWNALARVTVYEDPYWLQPFGWGLSPTYEGPDPGHLLLLIDANAGTPIQKWDNSWEMINFLRYDLTSIAYYLLPQADAFIIGAGGGRDILTGLLFGARQITAVELNPAIVEASREVFGDYAGHVYDYDNVRVEIEDARTYLARSSEQFDLIQASLIDTWAASSSGAYSLSENGLYTREAFLTHYERLSPRGMVSYSRWYFIADPTETLRMVALGLDSWQQAGVDRPADHLVVIANFSQNRSADKGLATMLLKKTPFTAEEVQTLVTISEEMDFTVLHAPGYRPPLENAVHDLATAADLQTAVAAYPLDISVPTDNRPFFFNFVRLSDLGRSDFRDNPAYHASAEANYALLAVLGIAALSAVLFIIAPLALRRRTLARAASWPYLLYFAALGVGFMLIMVPSIQRLTIYLGSPTYALAVVLFTILLSSGIGSRTTQRVAPGAERSRLWQVILGLVLVIGVHLPGIPLLVALTQSWPLAARIAAVILVILPAGFLMGQPFPLGIRWVSERRPQIVPWLWAVNGATSVIGSALATVLGLVTGFVAVSLVGMVCYGLALALATFAWQAAPVATEGEVGETAVVTGLGD